MEVEAEAIESAWRVVIGRLERRDALETQRAGAQPVCTAGMDKVGPCKTEKVQGGGVGWW